MKELRVIGLMSGTSLDGLDLAACTFSYYNSWKYTINHCTTVAYSKELISALQCLDTSTALEYAQTDHELGRLFGKEVLKFISATGFKPDYISSHGHTIFHQPEKHFTTQIGHPSAIAALTKTPVIADFRTVDVHLNGQGAPLVPIGDQYLFPEYKYCLNLGGIANISIKDDKGGIHAFDTGMANMALNLAAQKEGKKYDADGKMARKGIILSDLLIALNDLDYHKLPAPKSTGKEWFDSEVKPLVTASLKNHSSSDILATLCEHIARQIAIQICSSGKLLITGGGAKNDFLIERIKSHCKAEVVIPNDELIDYKEALIFAFLGALHINNHTNILQTVTGSSSSHVGGCLYNPFDMVKT